MTCLLSAPMKRLNQWLVICLMAALPGLANAATQTPDAVYQRVDHKVDVTYVDGTYLDNYLAAAESFEQVAQAAQQGQGGGEQVAEGDVFANADEAARQSSNPLGGDFMIILNEWHIDLLEGDITSETRYAYTHIFQPVIPIPIPALGDDWISVTRPTLPIIYDAEVPSGPGTFEHESGIGDVVLFSLLGRSIATQAAGGGDAVVAGGFTAMFPTGNDDFTSDKYSIGPAAVAAFIGRKFILGALGQHWWSFADNGSSHGDDVNLTNIQYFYFLNFPGGWQVGAAPTVEIDWEADSDDRWSVPIGLGVTKTQILFGKMPVKFGVEADYYVASPDTFGNEWKIKFTIAPILPNLIAQMFK